MTVASEGNAAQIRAIVEQAADAAMLRYAQTYPVSPPTKEAELPAGLKLAAGVITALISAAVIGVCFWIVTTLSDLQQTVTRIDERQQLAGEGSATRFGEIDRRVTRLESLHQRESNRSGE